MQLLLTRLIIFHVFSLNGGVGVRRGGGGVGGGGRGCHSQFDKLAKLVSDADSETNIAGGSKSFGGGTTSFPASDFSLARTLHRRRRVQSLAKENIAAAL